MRDRGFVVAVVAESDLIECNTVTKAMSAAIRADLDYELRTAIDKLHP